MKIKINVTKETLERSKFCKPHNTSTGANCAVAVAVRELFPNASIGLFTANLLGSVTPASYELCDLPVSASLFINRFDELSPQDRIGMAPFSFEIEVPEYVIQQIGIGTIYKVLSESKTMEHVNA